MGLVVRLFCLQLFSESESHFQANGDEKSLQCSEEWRYQHLKLQVSKLHLLVEIVGYD